MTLMRKMIHTKVYKVFLWIFLIAMVAGSGAMFFKPTDTSWVIKMYDKTMSGPQFQGILSFAKQQQEMFRLRGLMLPNQNVHKEAIESAIGNLLVDHISKELYLNVPQSYIDREVQKLLRGLPQHFFLEDGTLNQQAFEKMLAPLTIQDYLKEVELGAKAAIVYGIVENAAYIPKFELALQYNTDFADKNYSYILLPLQKYIHKARQQTPSDDVLQKFYKKSPFVEKFKTQERRSATVWTFNAQEYGAKVTDSEIKQYYDKHKMSKYIVSPAQLQLRVLLITIEPGKENQAKTRIQELHQQLEKEPSDFEKLARKFSDDKSTSSKGGLTDFFTKQDGDEKVGKIVADTAFEYLITDGQIAAPLKTDRGYELIQRVKKVPAKYKEFSAVEREIRFEIATEKFKKRFIQDAARVIQESKYTPGLIEKFAQRYHGVKSHLALDTRKSGIEYTQLFRLADEGRSAQFFNKDVGVILTCDSIERSFLPSLDSIKSSVLVEYYQHKGLEMMQDQLGQALKEAQTMSFADVAAKYQASVHTAHVTYTDGKLEQSAILKEAEVAKNLKNMQYQGSLVSIQTNSDGILIRLDEISKPKDMQSFDGKRDQLKKAMLYAKSYQSKEGFVASLYRIAKLNNKVEIKNEILQFTKEV